MHKPCSFLHSHCCHPLINLQFLLKDLLHHSPGIWMFRYWVAAFVLTMIVFIYYLIADIKTFVLNLLYFYMASLHNSHLNAIIKQISCKKFSVCSKGLYETGACLGVFKLILLMLRTLLIMVTMLIWWMIIEPIEMSKIPDYNKINIGDDTPEFPLRFKDTRNV